MPDESRRGLGRRWFSGRSLLVLTLAGLGVCLLLGQLGSRLGSIAFPASTASGAWLTMAAAAAAVLLFAPVSERPLPGRRTAAMAIALMASLWALHGLWASLVDPSGGLRAEATLTGEIGARRRSGVTDVRALRRYLPFAAFLDGQGRARVELSGSLAAPEDGRYRFLTAASSPGVAVIDGAFTIELDPLEPALVPLSRGRHRLRMEIEPSSGDGFVDLAWDRPSFFEPLGLASYVTADEVGDEDGVESTDRREAEARAVGLLIASVLWCLVAANLVVTLGGRRTALLPFLRDWSRRPAREWGGFREALALTAIFTAFGVVLALPTLSYPMAFDDLVLLRSFSPAQLLGALTGQWDPERLMNLGFRPGSLLFNHLRYSLFGDNVVAHRLLLLSLYGVYGALLVSVAARLGTDRRVATVAVVLALCSVYSVFHYVWITDGNHMVQGVSFVVAARLLLWGLDRPSRVGLALSIAAVFVGLLTREDTFAAIPALVLLGLFIARSSPSERRLLVLYAGALLLLCLALYGYRRWAVPHAVPFGHDALGLVRSVGRMLHPLGASHFDRVSRVASALWWVLVIAAFGMALHQHHHRASERERGELARIALWFGCAALACAPTLNLQRDNMFFFPSAFAALGFAELFARVLRRGRLAAVVAVAGLSVGIGGGFYVSRVFAENFHPESLRVVWWNGRYVYGAYARKAVIPEDRLAAVKERLASAGIRGEERHLGYTRHLERRAIANGRRRPDPAGRLFYPILPWGED